MTKSIVTVLVLNASGCMGVEQRTLTSYACEQRPPSDAGQSVGFKGTIGEKSERALHMDFETFGVDYNSVEVTLVSPEAWAGRSVPVFRHGRELIGDQELAPGAQLSFKAVVPDCLDAPWLFLEEIQPALLQTSVSAQPPY